MDLDDKGRRKDGRPLLYAEYINVDALIGALRLPAEVPQGAVAADWPVHPEGWRPGDPWPHGGNWRHDEVLFITVHQAFEVWFRQILHEVDDVLWRADALAKRHEVAIPRVNLARREGCAKLSTWRGRYPRVWALAESLPEQHPLRDEVDAPGAYALAEGPRLSWFDDELPVFTERLTRSALILRTCIPFYEVLQQMTPASFLEFRARLFPSSGFGSAQFRQLEIALGLRERHFDKVDWSAPEAQGARATLEAAGWELAGPPGRAEESFALHYVPADRGAVIRRMGAASLRDVVYWILNAPDVFPGGRRDEAVDASAERVFRDMVRVAESEDLLGRETLEHERWREMGAILAHLEVISAEALHHGPRAAYAFLEAAVSFDSALLEWRDAHIRFVERMIGARPGTGGGGLHYLRRTLGGGRTMLLDRAFPALWYARTVLHLPA